MNRQKWTIVLITCVVTVTFALQVRAASVAFEDFGFHNTGDQITGTDGVGWAAGWHGGNFSTLYSNSGSLFNSFIVYGHSTDTYAKIGGGTQGSDGRVFRDFDTSVGGAFDTNGYLDGNGNIGADGTTIYIAWASKTTPVTSNGNDSNYYHGFEFYRDGMSDSVNRHLQVSSDPADQALWLRGNNTIGFDESTAQIIGYNFPALTQLHYFVLKIIFGAGNADSASIFMDPQLNAPEGMPTATIFSTDLSFDGIALASFVGNPVYEVDDIRVGATYADVVGASNPPVVPLPTAVWSGLAGLIGLGLAQMRSRLKFESA